MNDGPVVLECREVFGTGFLKEGWESQNAEQYRRRVGADRLAII